MKHTFRLSCGGAERCLHRGLRDFPAVHKPKQNGKRTIAIVPLPRRWIPAPRHGKFRRARSRGCHCAVRRQRSLQVGAKDGSAAKWKVSDGYFEVVPKTHDIFTRQAFGDMQLHVEFAEPSPAVGEDQDRGNSGVIIMGLYEIQVLDSYQSKTYPDGQAGAVYGQYPPLVNASRPPGQWQTYDIVFHAPRFDGAWKIIAPRERNRAAQRRAGAGSRGNSRPYRHRRTLQGACREIAIPTAGSQPSRALPQYLGS